MRPQDPGDIRALAHPARLLDPAYGGVCGGVCGGLGAGDPRAGVERTAPRL